MNPHSNQPYTKEDLKECPFHNKKLQDSSFKEKILIESPSEALEKESNENKKCPIGGLDTEGTEADEQPEGSCPMMHVVGNKRNPPLYVPEPQYPNLYISPFQEYLSPNVSFKFARKTASVEKWNSYPIFLKNTIFYHSEKFKKYRGLEISYKFFVTDEIKESANEEYHKGNYDAAITILEKAIACLRWLDCTPEELPDFKTPSNDKLNDIITKKSEQHPELGALIKRKKGLSHARKESKKSEKSELDKFFDDKANRLLFTSYSDENVQLFDRHHLKTPGDHDMYDNIMFSLYNNMIAYYLKAGYIREAKQVWIELEKINPDNSIVLFRKSQLALADASSTIEELQSGLDALRKSIQSKGSDKIFQQNPTFLKSANLSNHEEVFTLLEQKLELTLKVRVELRKDQLTHILKRAKEIQETEDDILKRRLTPQESPESNYLMCYKADNVEMMILDSMLDKYRRIAEYYNTSEEQEQALAGKKGYQYVCGLRAQFLNLWSIDFNHLAGIEQELVNTLIKSEDSK